MKYNPDTIREVNTNVPIQQIKVEGRSDFKQIDMLNETKLSRLNKEKFQNQNSRLFFLGYDFIKGIIDENSLNIGYNITKRQFITVSLGFTYYHAGFANGSVSQLSPLQQDYPLFAYKGPTFRASYNYRIIASYYAGFDVFCKHLYYTDHTFEEYYDDEDSNFFVRNEDATVYGWHIDIGKMIYYSNNKWLYINPCFGIGQTTKYRTYTNVDSWMGKMDAPFGYHYANSSWLTLGKFSQEQKYISFNAGLIIGFK